MGFYRLNTFNGFEDKYKSPSEKTRKECFVPKEEKDISEHSEEIPIRFASVRPHSANLSIILSDGHR